MSEYQGTYLRLGRVLRAYSEQKGIAVGEQARFNREGVHREYMTAS
jgi:hypothetical protein